MSRFVCAALVLLVPILAAPLEAQDRRPALGKAIGTGALVGAGVAAVPGAVWGERMADGANALSGAGVMAGFGAASGALTGAAHALLPQRRGWKKYAQTTAVGLVASGLAFWALGELNGNVGPLHADAIRNIGVGHGALTAVAVVKFGR